MNVSAAELRSVGECFSVWNGCILSRGGTGHLFRIVVFGSFVTTKPDPNDVDVFLLMVDSFDVSAATGETRLLFDHLAADAHCGASVFWLRRQSAFDGEEAAVEYWQIKRDGQRRGIVELDLEAP